MGRFLSCDWGTSAFRLRLVRAADLVILAETTSRHGIAETYGRWEQQDARADRWTYYWSVLKDHLDDLGRQCGEPLAGIPIILSGMASSSIGWQELPYKELPFDLDGLDLVLQTFPADAGGNNPLVMVSGARTDDDVMRGEETKVLGCASMLAGTDCEQLIILPGTHPKHVVVTNGNVVDIKTYLTGELFQLLSVQSILAASVESGGDFREEGSRTRFLEGVQVGQSSNLLHALFMVRTNQVLKTFSKPQNFHYLSGLLIGSELKHLTPDKGIYLVSGPVHKELYEEALKTLGIPVSGSMDADLALVRGHRAILKQNKYIV